MNDQTAWPVSLADKLEQLAEGYRKPRSLADGLLSNDEAAKIDPLEARVAATAGAAQSLVQIMLALNALPSLHGTFRDGPIPDLLAALDDLRRGQVSAFFQPISGRRRVLMTRWADYLAGKSKVVRLAASA